MKKIIFILCAATCVCTMSCQNNSNLSQAEKLVKEGAKNPNINVSQKEYSVNVPTGWRETDTTIQGLKVRLIFAPNVDSNFKSNMTILNENMQGRSFSDYFNATSLGLRASASSFKELGQGDFVTDSGVKGKWEHYSLTRDGINFEHILYAIPIDGIAYLLAGTSTLGNLDKYRNDFDAIAKSFHIK